MRDKLKQSRKIVVKAGTSILTAADGRIDPQQIDALVRQVLTLRAAGRKVVLVSSGAIAFGMEACGLASRPREMAALQACAAIGQNRLMHAYETRLAGAGVAAAQVLLTRDGLEIRKRFLSARHTFEKLFEMEALPIVNENDTVASEEIAFGDNDILSVQVGHLVHADMVFLLSDVDGFYLKDGSRIREVASESEIDRELVKHLKDSRKERTVGGMRAKLQAARLAMKLGVPLCLLNGHEPDAVAQALAGEDVGTLFWQHGAKKNARKKWIAYSAARRGTLTVDQGAYEALAIKKRSLLPSGLRGIQGSFSEGDVVELCTQDGGAFGRGVVRYSSRDLNRIAGKKTGEIEVVLGYKGRDEVVHRNDLVLWG